MLITLVAEDDLKWWQLDICISILKTFCEEDVHEWFQRLEIYCSANKWNNETKALKLPNLLEGEALAVWLELLEEQWADCTIVKEQLITKMGPIEFVSLEEFHSHKMRPGEAITLYLYDLKCLLQQAMTGLVENASKQL